MTLMTNVFGVEMLGLPDDAIAIDAIVMIKALDHEGNPCVYTRTSPGLGDFEKLGILEIECDRIKTAFRDYDAFIPDVEDEDEEAEGTEQEQ